MTTIDMVLAPDVRALGRRWGLLVRADRASEAAASYDVAIAAADNTAERHHLQQRRGAIPLRGMVD